MYPTHHFGAARLLSERTEMHPVNHCDPTRRAWTVHTREEFTDRVWMAAAALVTAVLTAFLGLAFLSPEVNIQLPRGQMGAGAGGD